jgi:hypothetical protein
VASSFYRFYRRWRFVSVLLTTVFLVPPSFAASGFAPQKRVGFNLGDQWEPAIAADAYSHVYILYPQYGVVPGCANCPVPSMVLVVSNDNGATWQMPRQITPPGTGQFDAQIVVDPADRRTVYAAWLQNDKNDAVVAKSVDFGQSWSVVVADRSGSEADKPVLAVRGQDVYVGFERARKMRVASSHDGGVSFIPTDIFAGVRLAGAMAGGATVDPSGNVYFAWAGYAQNPAVKGRANLYTTKSSDGGKTWTFTPLDVSGVPPDCAPQQCGWAYLGAQVTLASDAAGTLYALWNAGTMQNEPERIYFASSTTAGATWSPKLDVSQAPPGVEHCFPALTTGSAGDVRIGWMDTRNRPLWNTYYRSSTNGGATWSPETQLSSYVRGYHYIQPNGFSFPFGDYFEMSIDSRGETHAVWGEGLNYNSPGSIWHTSGR